MCSITGIYNFKNNSNIDKIVLENMSSALKHRGPDHSEIFINNEVGFAHNRLSILDHNSRSNQPFKKDGKILIFNGFIYNYLEIKTDLLEKGYSFQTTGDTEVLLSAFEEYGPQCVHKFNGMWSFAIYDQKDSSLFCSRDRFGIKPFYYTLIDSTFYFASEQKAFANIPSFSYGLNKSRFEEFVATGALEFDQETLFSNISQLPAGHNLVLNKTLTKPIVKSYFDFTTKPYQGSYAQAKEKFKDLLKESVNRRLRADVNLGVTLSGGIDSNSIVSMINPSIRENLISISSADPNDPLSEYNLIKDSAKFYQIKNIHVKPREESFMEQFRSLIRTQETPVFSTSIFAQNSVYQLAHESNLTVCLSGQGADEALMGYDLFIKKQILNKPLHFILSPNSWHYLFKKRNPKVESNQILRKAFHSHYNHSSNALDDLSKISENMITKSVLPSLLHFEDRNSMQYAVESRLPFLDYTLVLFVLSLKEEWRIGKFERKKILKDTLGTSLPSGILKNKRKSAFYSPTSSWLENINFDSKQYLEIISKHNEFLKPSTHKDSKQIRFRKWSIANWLEEFNVQY